MGKSYRCCFLLVAAQTSPNAVPRDCSSTVMLELVVSHDNRRLSLQGSELLDHVQRLAPDHIAFSSSTLRINIIEEGEVSNELLLDENMHISQEPLQVLSLSEVDEHKLTTVSWPLAQLFRKSLGARPRPLSISLYVSEISNSTIRDITYTIGGYATFFKTFNRLSKINTNYICADWAYRSLLWHKDHVYASLRSYPNSYRALNRVADVTDPHVATNAYALTLRCSLKSVLEMKVIANLQRLASQAPCGPFHIDSQETTSVFAPWSSKARAVARHIVSNCPTLPRMQIVYEGMRMPRFFTMPIPYRLAGMSTPKCEADTDLLASIGITTVLPLTKEEPMDPVWFKYKKITNILIPHQ